MLNIGQLKKALLYEGGAIASAILIVPYIIQDTTVLDVGLLGIFSSILTVTLLYFYNICFDQILLQQNGSTHKSETVRIIHTLAFKCILTIMSVLLVPWWLTK